LRFLLQQQSRSPAKAQEPQGNYHRISEKFWPVKIAEKPLATARGTDPAEQLPRFLI